MKILSIVGARPNFMKVAPFIRAINNYNKISNSEYIQHLLVHTGQHYDDRMSKKFFEELEIPEPDINLGIGSGSHAEQVGYSMIALEKVLQHEKPDWVVVFGDVNATLSASLAAKKLWINLCHIEAGLRSGDMKMPEEINRLVTDRLSDLLLTPDLISSLNLLKEGIPEYKIKHVGNIMIDTLDANLNKASQLDPDEILARNHKSGKKILSEHYALMTLHRPSNVDVEEVFSAIVQFLLDEIAFKHHLIWPVHPRAFKQLVKFGLLDKVATHPGITLLEPLSYLEMLRLNKDADIMLTDSGGLQEECTVLGTPCLTLRSSTERPVTLRQYGGVSVLVGNNIESIRKEYFQTLNQERKPVRPYLWDGKTAERCLNEILNYSH
jgi:UDP-N-acetylglucosamine 2-epimerase (non-hydrolysing)